MAWGSKVAATQLTSITTEQFFTFGSDAFITLNPLETAHIQISVDFPGTPTDHATISVYTTLDDSSEDWDEIAFIAFRISNTSDTHEVSFLVSDVYKFRIGVQRTGTTDTITSADCSYRVNGVTA